MFESNAKKLTLKCVVLVLLILGLILFSKDSTKSLLASSQTRQDRAQLPAVSIEPQDDIPLRIISAIPLFLDSETYTVQVLLQNQSSKKVRAFAIAADNTSGGNGGLVMFLNLVGSNAVLLPTQMRSVDIKYSLKGSPTNVTLSMDFVELSDGSTWGPDVNKSRDKLVGQREGAKMERQRLNKLFKVSGRSALLNSIEGNGASDINPGTDPGHSEEWREGFRRGVETIRRGVREALKTNNLAQVELELAKSYDTSEGNQK